MSLTPDIWSEALYAARFAGIPLDVLVTQDDLDRSLAEIEYPRVDGADIQPMGNGPRRSTLRILFFEREPDEDDEVTGFATDDHINRLSTFIQTAMTAQEPLELIHPLFGSYQAWVRNVHVDANADDRNQVAVECQFVEDSTAPSVILGPEIAPVHTGMVDVTIQADAFRDGVASLGLDDDSPAVTLHDDVSDAMTRWEDPDTTSRDVNGDLSRLSDHIDDALNDISYATDLDRIQLLRTAARLHGSIRRAADQFKRTAPQIVEYEVRTPQPLRAIAVALYGAAQAQRRTEEMQRLNDVGDPGMVPAGTVLRRVADNPVGVNSFAGLRGKVSR